MKNNLTVLVVVFAFAGCVVNQYSDVSHNIMPSACSWVKSPSGYLPDPTCSPGDILSSNTSVICVTGYTATVRNVSEKKKNGVYAAYGVVNRTTGEYEMDHIIPLELGGSNEVKNLFPEPADPHPGFHEKDKVENWLHDQVCNHGMPIEYAQTLIAKNWTMAYELMN